MFENKDILKSADTCEKENVVKFSNCSANVRIELFIPEKQNFRARIVFFQFVLDVLYLTT